MMEKNFLPNVINTLLDEVSESYKLSNNTVTDDVLQSLFGVFDKILYNALELIETNSITRLHLKSTLSVADEALFQVTNMQGSSYVLFHRVNYCQCMFYRQKVIISNTYLACKHFIAANLAYIWNKCVTFEIDFENYKHFLDEIPRNN